MATYAELNAILTDTVPGAQALREKVGVACLIAGQLIVSHNDDGEPFDQTAGAHDKRQQWTDRLLSSYQETVRQLFAVVIAANASATQSQILNATDSAIQNSVNTSIDALATNVGAV